MLDTRGIRKQGSQISSRTSSVVSLDPLSLDGSDPLSHFAKLDSFDEVDPLTKIATEYVNLFFHDSTIYIKIAYSFFPCELGSSQKQRKH